MFPRSGHERVQAGCVNAVVIRDQKFHRGRNYYVAQPGATSPTLPLEPASRWAIDFVETRRKSGTRQTPLLSLAGNARLILSLGYGRALAFEQSLDRAQVLEIGQH
jgi:hypothetical protein